MTMTSKDIEMTLNMHSQSILDLQDAATRLEGGHERQSQAIHELTLNFGNMLGEISKLGFEVRNGKNDLTKAISRLSDHVIKLDSGQKSFRNDWQSVCDERHKLVDFRLKGTEKRTQKALNEVDEMSENSKIQFIKDLQDKIHDYEEQIKAEQAENRSDERIKKNAKLKIIGLLISGLLTGTGGAVLIQWILGV